MAVAWVVSMVGAYVLGTFPTAILVGRRRGLDPTKEGSGNPGATNMYRVAGKKAGAIVLVGDIAKGVIPALVGWAVDGRSLAFACWAAAVVGHIVPVLRKFRGGKGVATAGGGVLALLPLVAGCCIVVFVAVVKTTKKGSLGSVVMAALVPILAGAFGRPGWEVAVSAGVSAVVILRHWSNLVRLVHGTERAVRAASSS
jgi:glycerol-3-phosphate acyltransferase PlsY